jgi:GTP cyclohydrolase I
MTPDEKIEKIQKLFGEIMQTLGMDMTDDSLKDSPKRVAKMYVNEIFGGLLPENKPGISTFSNKYKYRQMLVEKDITVYSFCEHHFLPIIGKAHVAYISNGEVIGLSKSIDCRLLRKTSASAGKINDANCRCFERSSERKM